MGMQGRLGLGREMAARPGRARCLRQGLQRPGYRQSRLLDSLQQPQFPALKNMSGVWAAPGRCMHSHVVYLPKFCIKHVSGCVPAEDTAL